MEIETENNVKLTGNSQYSFKEQKRTTTAGLTFQSIITNHVDVGEYVFMASLDLSAALDIVNINLLMKRQTLLGLPSDVLRLIKTLLSNRTYYFNINGINSEVIVQKSGTLQGPILGPILYAIYVSPLFDLTHLTNFDGDNFAIQWSNCIAQLINNMEKVLEMVTK